MLLCIFIFLFFFGVVLFVGVVVYFNLFVDELSK